MLNAAIFFSSGVCVSLWLSTRDVIVPSCVFSAMPVIIALPLPFITDVPLKTILNWSPKATSFSNFSVFFSVGSDSPVSDDSSHCNWLASTNRASPGITSPASSTTKSPTVIFSEGICNVFPSRITLESITSISFKAFIELRACNSIKKPINAFTKMTTPIAMASI